MRILVISDIHGNINALRTVITDAGKVDTIWCLGDIVGYGPDPNECVDLLRELPELVCLLGNHDAAVANPAEVATFNPEARISIEWTIDQLRPDNFEYLSRLPNRVILDEVTLVHGSPRSPTYEYLLDTYMATINFAYFKTSFCFVGHTHLPVQFSMGNGLGYAELLIPKERDTMQMVHRSILNPARLASRAIAIPALLMPFMNRKSSVGNIAGLLIITNRSRPGWKTTVCRNGIFSVWPSVGDRASEDRNLQTFLFFLELYRRGFRLLCSIEKERTLCIKES